MLKISIFFCLPILIQACGTAHIQSKITSDVSQYSSAYISEVDIQSREQNNDSLEMNKKMEAYANGQLQDLIKNKGYQLATSSGFGVLAFKIDIDIVYGSRAARYWAGFGAGKGSVKSTFEVVDSKTREVKYSISGASDLSMGAFGGSMEAVIKQNINKLLSEFSASM